MAGPNLPVNIDTSYADSGTDATVKLHQQHHDVLHGIANAFDTGLKTASTGNVLAWNGSVYAPASASGGAVAMAFESDAGVTTANSAATNLANFNAWASANPGVPIFIRAGVYDFAVTSSLSPKGNIFGAGPGVTVLRFAETSNGLVYIVGRSNITVADVEIRSTSTATPASPGNNSSSSNLLTLDGCTLFTIKNVYANGAGNMGIHVRASSRGVITQCKTNGTTRDGIHVTSAAVDVSIVGNQVYNTGDDGIASVSYTGDSAPNKNIAIVGNVIHNAGRARGICVEGTLGATVSGNVIDTTVSPGIIINSPGSVSTDTWGTVNCSVTGNVIQNAGTDGIHVNGNNADVLISGNVIRSAGSAAIRVLLGRVTINGNLIDQNASGPAINLTNAAGNQFSVVTNNVIRRAYAQAIYSETPSLTFSGNVVQQPNEDGTVRSGALFYNCSALMVTDNRFDGTSGRMNYGIYFDTVTGALVQGNYATNASSATTGSANSTGLLTS